MSLPVIQDSRLPGLALAADQTRLNRAIDAAIGDATGGVWRCRRAGVQRFRYRKHQRAILQLVLEFVGPEGRLAEIPGALWLYPGGKVRDRAEDTPPPTGRELPQSLFEPSAGGLLTLFPYDRRVPEIAAFCTDPAAHAKALIGAAATGPPVLSRYRPGLGATFRWPGQTGTAFVKVFNQHSAKTTFTDLQRLAGLCARERYLVTPEPLGFSDEIGAVALRAAPGRHLGEILRNGSADELTQATGTVLDGFSTLNGLGIEPRRARTAEDLLQRATTTAGLVKAADPTLGLLAGACVQVLRQDVPRLRSAPVHMDMKIEHVLLDGDRAVFLDLDSLALSDPLYDPAMLSARIEIAAQLEEIPRGAAATACTILKESARTTRDRTTFRWLRAIARLQLVRFLAQNPRRHWRRNATQVLNKIEQTLSLTA